MPTLTSVLKDGIAVVATGHGYQCNAPKGKKCRGCESRQFSVTGVLAFLAGGITFVIGWLYSLAAQTDSLHAFADGGSDGFGVWVSIQAKKAPERAKAIRKRANRVIAALLALGALWILSEVYDRVFAGGHHLVDPAWVFFAGLTTCLVDGMRVRILYHAYLTDPNDTVSGLLVHALSDLLHSAIVLIVGGTTWISEFAFAGLMAVDIQIGLRWLDLVLSTGLATYMLYLTKLIWQGKHHGHYLLGLLFRLAGKTLPHSHKEGEPH